MVASSMFSAVDDPERAVTKMYNSAIMAAAIPTAWEIGLLDAIRTYHTLNISDFAAQHDLDTPSMHALAAVLEIAEVLKYTAPMAIAGRLFDEAYRARSLFHWLTLGSGGLFARMPHVLHNANRIGDYHGRDAAALAYSCREINHGFFDPTFWRVMDGLTVECRSFADLGCGSGERLMQLLERHPAATALGIDIAPAAIGFAEDEARQRGFQTRLSFMVGDARALDSHAAFADVDLLTCFMMGHDFWPRDNCIKTLRSLRLCFPKAQRLILGDATRALLPSKGQGPKVTGLNDSNVPAFTLGLEFGHVLMGVYIPTLEEWLGVFEEGGWRCVQSHELPEFAFGVIFELEPLGESV